MKNAEIYGVHLLHALLEQEEGIVTPVLQKIGVGVADVRAKVRDEIDRLARVTGGSEPRLNRDLDKAMTRAEEHARTLEDEYVSIEHLLLGLTEEKADAGDILRTAGATTERVLEALEAVRGSHRVTDQTPEDTYQALDRYSRDLTDSSTSSTPSWAPGRPRGRWTPAT